MRECPLYVSAYVLCPRSYRLLYTLVFLSKSAAVVVCATRPSNRREQTAPGLGAAAANPARQTEARSSEVGYIAKTIRPCTNQDEDGARGQESLRGHLCDRSKARDHRASHGWPRAHGRENVGASAGASWRFVGIGVRIRIVSSAVDRDCRVLGWHGRMYSLMRMRRVSGHVLECERDGVEGEGG